MFVKEELVNGVAVAIEIKDGENTYTHCGDCGCEILISLEKVLDTLHAARAVAGDEISLDDIGAFCEDCSIKRLSALKKSKLVIRKHRTERLDRAVHRAKSVRRNSQ